MSPYHTFTDVKLTKLLVSGDNVAFNEIYHRFQGLLYVYACKITRNDDEAEDIVQEVFVYLWDKRATLSFTSDISSYLYSAVRYKFFNLLDHKKVRQNYQAAFQEFIDQGEHQADYYIREKELRKLIEYEIAALPDKMREVFELSRKQNLSRKDIAKKMDISEKTVKNQINSALKILRKRLGLFGFLMLLLYK